MKLEIKYWARRCSATGEGFNQGYVIQDGEHYIKDKSRAKSHILLMGYSTMKEAYSDGYYAYTEWDGDEDMEYIEINGNMYTIDDRIRIINILLDLANDLKSSPMWTDEIESDVDGFIAVDVCKIFEAIRFINNLTNSMLP